MSAEMKGDKASRGALAGRRVLVAEDRSLIATKVVQILRRADCVVVEAVATLQAGLDLTRREDVALDAAVLDIDLRGEPVYPLAEALQGRGVPFLFLTGYGELVIPVPWRGVARLEKPFDEAALLGGLHAAIAARPTGPATPGAPAAVRREWLPGRAQPLAHG
jgi:DNA-binding response OmpR family regulator